MKPLYASTEGTKIYREAARRLESLQGNRGPLDGYACWAILEAEGIPNGEKNVYIPTGRLLAFQELFAPEGLHCGLFWWDRTPEGDASRILALCFMAAMVEAGDA